MKLNKHMNLTLAAMVLVGGVSLAVAEEMVPNYTKDSAGSVVKDISGECAFKWRNRRGGALWMSSQATAKQ